MHPFFNKKQWQAQHRAACEALERIYLEDLRNLTNEEATRRILSLNTPDPVWRERPDWSGLVEQQAIFHRRRKP
ncbi:MAG TPA: hypothetical protein VMD30_07730 [Tepidisphaeraceae bacterium]|nr:hypothetical protein [Tepidisphaeraceae bacterium]